MMRTSWYEDAACRGADINMFFPQGGANENAAKAVCAHCTVTDQCLAEALPLPPSSDFGIYGGLNSAERDRLRQRSRRKKHG